MMYITKKCAKKLDESPADSWLVHLQLWPIILMFWWLWNVFLTSRAHNPKQVFYLYNNLLRDKYIQYEWNCSGCFSCHRPRDSDHKRKILDDKYAQIKSNLLVAEMSCMLGCSSERESDQGLVDFITGRRFINRK